MDERKKRKRPSKADRAQKREVRPPRIEPENRFDDLLKELRTPAPAPPISSKSPKPLKDSPKESPKENTLATGSSSEGVNVQLERGMLDVPTQSKKVTGKSSDPDYCRMTLYLRKDTHRKFKTKATALGMELSDVLESLVANWLTLDDISDPFLKHFSVPRNIPNP